MFSIKKLLCIGFVFICTVAEAETFVINNIRITGLQRISADTVLSYLPVKVGDSIDTVQTSEIIRALYKTQFFSDVALERSNNDLLISVVEHSVIGSINITGNSKITKKQLLEVLKSVDITEGRPLIQSTINAIQQAIIQQYYNLGLYAAKVNIDIKSKERNRASVAINVVEGPVAKIRSIKIVGNKVFSEKVLLKECSLTTPKLWSFWTNSDRYSQEKFDADLEKLRIYYMDRGYLHVAIESTKVSITPDKKNIYIVIGISEGAVYRVGGFSVEGNLLGKHEEIQKLIGIKSGTVFSRQEVIDAQARITDFLGNYGYGMPSLRVDPEVNENSKKVQVKFIVDPGHRVYIRRIDFSGNTKTNDDVLRREMRLQEGGVFSLAKLNESRRRLANLGYIQDIEYKVTQVPESNNQVDLAYEVKETSAITASLQAGFSDKEGFIYGANIVDKNFLGAGKSVSIGFDNTKASQTYSLGYYNPYFTADNIGFSINASLRKSNPGRVDLSPYSTDTYGVLASFDVPLSDYSRVNFGLGVEHISLGMSSNPSTQVQDFVNSYGSSFNQFKLITGWSYSNLDRALFPTSGFAQSLSLEGDGPLNAHGLEFYKIDHTTVFYLPLFRDFVFRTGTDIGYGDGIGKTKDLPFFKNFFVGGIGSVRGFEADSLGDERDSNNKTLGGKFSTVASASLILPSPLKDSIRPSIFVDVGNVYSHGFHPNDLRSSYGMQIEWRTPLAPLLFCFAKPIKKKSGDNLDVFQFSISASI